MAATETGRTATAYQVGQPVQLQHEGQIKTGRISSIHRIDGGFEYVVRTDPLDDGMGTVINVRAIPGRPTLLTPIWPAPEAGAAR
jgi:hypothetical protein